MYPMKMIPVFKDYLWGGERLALEYGKRTALRPLAESWEVSCHPDGPSVVENGKYAGRTLASVLEEHPRWMGKNGAGGEFPVLIKLIDAEQNLSLQVHPNDQWAREVEGQQGKNEMWYVLDATPGAELLLGCDRAVSREEFRNRIADNTLMEIVHREKVTGGDCFCVPAGMLHGIGAGVLVAEIQQNSNVTYRVYDYDRRDQSGNARELHVDKAVAVTDTALTAKNVGASAGGDVFGAPLTDWDYFTASILAVDGEHELLVDEDSFVCLLCTRGEIAVSGTGGTAALQKGESAFLPAGMGYVRLQGGGDLLVTRLS